MNQLGLGVVYSTSTSFSRIAARSASGMPPSSGPVVRNSSPPAVLGVGALDRAVGVVDLDAVHVAGPHRGHEVGVGDRIGVAGAAQQRAEEEHAQGETQQRPQAPAGHALAREAAAPRPTRRRGRRGRQTLRAHGDRIRVGCSESQPGGPGIHRSPSGPWIASRP